MNSRVNPYRIPFVLLYVSFFGLRGYYSYKSSPASSGLSPEERKSQAQARFSESKEREGLNLIIRTLLSPVMTGSIVLYALNPPWLKRLALPLPAWMRVSGGALATASIPLLIWTHQTLGKQWSPNLELIEDHALVTDGPYHWVRHPMYTVLFSFMTGISLLSANMLVAMPHLAAMLTILARLDKEEAMMLEEFGQDYETYMKQTGRFLPKVK